MDTAKEQARQRTFPWSRSKYHSEYNAYLAKFKVESCLEHARGTSVLDLACGDGLMTEMFAAVFERVVGVDANGAHLAQARERVPRAEFHEALIENFETAERFGTVLLLDILEHVLDPVAVLRKAGSLLADGGVVIAHVPNAAALNRRLAVLMGTLERMEELSPFDIDVAGHRRYYTLPTLREDFARAGFELAATGGILLKMLSTPQMDWFLQNGLWAEGGFGWGRVGGPRKDWKDAFCRASYELGKQRPEDCNLVFACGTRAGPA